MTELIIFSLFTALMTGIALLSKSKIYKNVAVTLLFIGVVHTVFLGGGTLRKHAELAREQGRPYAFIEGMARLNKIMVPVKLKILMGTFGVFLITLGAINGKRAETKD